MDDGTFNIIRIPISMSDDDLCPIATDPFILFVPTYGGGSDGHAIPRQVRRFLNIPENRNLIQGVVGLGNINFGDHYCKAADLVSRKTGVPVLARVEIFGTQEDVSNIREKLKHYG